MFGPKESFSSIFKSPSLSRWSVEKKRSPRNHSRVFHAQGAGDLESRGTGGLKVAAESAACVAGASRRDARQLRDLLMVERQNCILEEALTKALFRYKPHWARQHSKQFL